MSAHQVQNEEIAFWKSMGRIAITGLFLLTSFVIGLYPQPSPHFQTSPKVSVKALFWLNNSVYLAMRGRSLCSGMLGMRS